jgi:serine-type D-Ala-D-Ala carboxypeptidase/endopeptidase (penicillin-binding protein 4)
MAKQLSITTPTRRAVLLGLLASTATGSFAKAPDRSPRPVPRAETLVVVSKNGARDIAKKAGLSGEVCYVVADAATGQVLDSRKPLLALPPASVAKSLTALYGLSALGGNYRFSTRLVASGPVVNGRLEGDLYLVGGGDPTLQTDALADLARDLKAKGVREISGKAYVYGGALPYQSEIDADQPVYLGYNPSLSGLNLNYNRIYFEWAKSAQGYTATMDARDEKHRPMVGMATIKTVDRTTPIFTLNSTSRQDNWTVAEFALGKKGGRWLPVRRPQFYAAEVFQTIARSYGIKLPKFIASGHTPAGTVLAEWRSDDLMVMLRGMMKYSTNIVAEAVGMTASQARGNAPKSLSGSARIMSDWLNQATPAKRVKFIDHSGLGDGSRISASDMTQVLLQSGWDGPLRALIKDIRLRDSKGRPLKNQQVAVKAKTGTLNFVSALAGYMTAKSGRKLVFAIFTADLPRRAKVPKSQRERPLGAKAWSNRSRGLQQSLITQWAATL